MGTERHEGALGVRPAKGFDIGRLERELTAMWSQATAVGEGGERPGVTRACVLNLIVYAPASADRQAIDALLDEVFESNPCRALVLFADRDSAEERLDAYVNTRCSQSSKGARQICGEQITVEADGASVGRAASVLVPLLVPDVPVFLWWKDIPHYEDKLFERLVGVADRVVIDSAAFDHPREDLLRLSEVIRANPEHMAVSDLGWGRLTPWRSLVASFWDVRDYAPLLRNLKTVELTFDAGRCAPGQIPAPALLCAGWLASRLGWKITRPGERRDGEKFVAEAAAADGHTVRIVFGHSEPEAEHASGLRTLTLTSGEGGAEFRVGLKAGELRLESGAWLGDDRPAVDRLTDFPEHSEGEWLSGELAILTRDRVYEQAVAAAAELLASLSR